MPKKYIQYCNNGCVFSGKINKKVELINMIQINVRFIVDSIELLVGIKLPFYYRCIQKRCVYLN